MHFSTDWLTDLLMPSDKHNSRIARAKDLIFSRLLRPEMCLFTNRSCYSACIRVLPFYPFDLPYFSSQLHKVTICGRHVMASVRDIKIAEALVVLCLAYYVVKWVRHCWNWGVMAFMYGDMGHTFHNYILRIFCNSWMDCRDASHAVLCFYCCITNKT